MNHDGVATATALLLAAFAVERVASAVTFVLSRPKGENATQAQLDTWNHKLQYFIVAGIVAIFILALAKNVRVMTMLGLIDDKPDFFDNALDAALTFMVLVGGAERLSSLFKVPEPEVLPQKDGEVMLQGKVQGDVAVQAKGAGS